MFCGCCTTWLLAAFGRREAPSPASGPKDSPHDEPWAADRSRRRFAPLTILWTGCHYDLDALTPKIVKDGTPDQRDVLQAPRLKPQALSG